MSTAYASYEVGAALAVLHERDQQRGQLALHLVDPGVIAVFVGRRNQEALLGAGDRREDVVVLAAQPRRGRGETRRFRNELIEERTRRLGLDDVAGPPLVERVH